MHIMRSNQDDLVAKEIVQTLREWHRIWRTVYLSNQHDLLERISVAITDLFDLRKQLLHNHQSHDQLKELKFRIVSKIDAGNKLLNLDLVPRIDSQIVNPRDICPIKLLQIHCEASCDQILPYSKSSCTNSNISSSTSSSSTSTNSSATHNLKLTVKDINLSILNQEECTEMYISVIDATNMSQIKFMTEKHLVRCRNDTPSSPVSTIFTDFSNTDIGRDLYLFIQIYRIGRMNITDGMKTLGRHQTSTNTIAANSRPTTNGSTNPSQSNTNSTPGKIINMFNNIVSIGLSENQYKRPYGGAIVPITESVRGSHQEKEYQVKINACNENDFHQLHETLLRKQTSKLNQTSPGIDMNIALRFFRGDYNLFLKDECVTRKRGFPDVVMPGDFRNDLHFVLESGEFEKGGKSIPKNIEACISLVDSKGITIDKCISYGSGVANVTTYKSGVYYHSNSPKWNESLKFIVPLDEFEGAHVRIEFRHCSTKDKGKRFLGFCYMPLSDTDGTVISNKQHELYLYRYDVQNFEDENLNMLSYTLLPYGPGSKNAKMNGSVLNSSTSRFFRNTKEVIYVSTFLLSTKLTQNSDLLTLLKWRELDPDDIKGALEKVLYMDGEEIVKFLQDILDTLFDTFAIFSTSEVDPKKNCSGFIFKVLVHIFLLLDEPKYSHFKPVLETYVSAHFSATLVYKGLLSCVKQCADYSSDVDKHVPIQGCFKSLHYVFQFIIQSRLLYIKATEHNSDSDHFLAFATDLRLLFKSFDRMLMLPTSDVTDVSDSIFTIQAVFLKAFPFTFDQLLKVMEPMDLTGRITRFIDGAFERPNKMGCFCYSLPQTILKARLKFIQDTLESVLCRDMEPRQRIIETCCKHLEHLISSMKEIKLCAEILSTMLIKCYDFHWPKISELCIREDNNTSGNHNRFDQLITIIDLRKIVRPTKYANCDLLACLLTNELSPIVLFVLNSIVVLLDKLIKDAQSNKILIQQYYACLFTILKLMNERNYNQFLNNLRVHQKEFLLSFFRIVKYSKEIYDKDWLVMKMLADSIAVCSLDQLSRPLKIEVSNSLFDKTLWNSYFNLTIEILIHPNLQLETFTDYKRTFILKNFGDLRLCMGRQILNMWKDLGSFKVSLSPTMVMSLLEITFLPIDELQKETMPAFYDLIDTEYKLKNDFRQVEKSLMDSMEVSILSGKGDTSYADLFNSILVENIESKSPVWKDQGLRFARSLNRQIHLLLDLGNIPDVPEKRNKRMNCLVKLLYFYKLEYKRNDMYVKYIYELCDMHLPSSNYVEAAFTLKLYADILDWSNKILNSLDGYHSREEEWKRKEMLYLRIIDYFDQGKCWEEAISLCKELAFFYETCLVDYSRLSNILKRLATFIDSILNNQRPAREYFRVGFYGSDFPSFIKNKEYIFRGKEYEGLPAFMQRILNEYPDATILSSASKQQINCDASGQNIVISNVKPVPCLEPHLKCEEKNISEKIIGYYLNNRLDTFFYDKPIQKGVGDKENEFRTLWVERTTLKLYEALPGILPWFEIGDKTVTEISPINLAIETVSNMNSEMSKLICKYRYEKITQIRPLTMRLQGVIDAPVNGGIAVFIDAFLSPKYTQISPHCSELVLKLKDLIKHQIRILESGLLLHERLATPEWQPLHAILVERLSSIKSSLIDTPSPNSPHPSMTCSGSESGTISRVSIVNQPLPPMPTSNKSNIPTDEDDFSSDSNYDDQIYSLVPDPPDRPIPNDVERRDDRLTALKSPECTSSLSSIAIVSNFPQNRPKSNCSNLKSNNNSHEVFPNKNLHLDSQSSLQDIVNHRLAQNNNLLQHKSSEQCSYNKDANFSLWSNPSSNTNSLIFDNASPDNAPPLPPRTMDRIARHEILAHKDKISNNTLRTSEQLESEKDQLEVTSVDESAKLVKCETLTVNSIATPPPLPNRQAKAGSDSEFKSVSNNNTKCTINDLLSEETEDFPTGE